MINSILYYIILYHVIFPSKVGHTGLQPLVRAVVVSLERVEVDPNAHGPQEMPMWWPSKAPRPGLADSRLPRFWGEGGSPVSQSRFRDAIALLRHRNKLFSGGRLCALIGVPWQGVSFSTLSTG